MKIGIFQSMDISSSGLKSERQRLSAAAENIANIKTTRTEDGTYYKPKEVSSQAVKADVRQPKDRTSSISASKKGHITMSPKKINAKYEPGGVKSQINDSKNAPIRVYEPEHPHAGEDGFVEYPDIDLPRQMAEAITAIRAYEANIGVIGAAKFMFKKAMEI